MEQRSFDSIAVLKLGDNFSDLNFLYKIYVYTVYMPYIVFSILNS